MLMSYNFFTNFLTMKIRLFYDNKYYLHTVRKYILYTASSFLFSLTIAACTSGGACS